MTRSYKHAPHCTCAECDIPQLARNHYFTGKLMVERDFTDEQRYFMGKQRRHNQLLHGWGTVCGLKVKQHPTEDCRDQYIIVEPGMAIDCCDREILVSREAYFDFRVALEAAWRAENPDIEPDGSPQSLRICLRYKECPTEEVPALFDECGCDDTACLPNRILESYELELRLGEATPDTDPRELKLAWNNTLHIGRPVAAAIHSDSRQLAIISQNAEGTLYLVDTENHSIVRIRNLGGQPQDVAISADGTRAYVSAVVGDPPDAGTRVFIVNLDSDPGRRKVAPRTHP